MDSNVRPIILADLPQLLRLCRMHAEYEGATWYESKQVERWTEAFFTTKPDVFGWVAETDGRIFGFMTVTVDYATWDAAKFAHMDCLFIEEDFRGYGTGRRFFECLEQFCRNHGCTHAQWQTPLDNQIGIDFYKHMGAASKTKLRFFLSIVPTERI